MLYVETWLWLDFVVALHMALAVDGVAAVGGVLDG